VNSVQVALRRHRDGAAKWPCDCRKSISLADIGKI